MGSVAESGKKSINGKIEYVNQNSLDEKSTTPWIGLAVQQAEFAFKTFDDALGTFIAASRSRLSEIQTTSLTHFSQTIDSMQEFKTEYLVYEDVFFQNMKAGILVAASHPMVISGVAFSLVVAGCKRPRRFLYHNIKRLFVSEKSLLSKAEAKVKDLRKSVDLLKGETEKLEDKASQAEGEMNRGMRKLRHAGKQIQDVIRAAHKIEKHATGLKSILGELPHVEASRFQSQVSKLASEALQERKALCHKVSRICNNGISV